MSNLRADSVAGLPFGDEPSGDPDLAAVWSQAVAGVADGTLSAQQRAWLRLTRPLGLVQDTALLAAPNEFTKDLLDSRLRPFLSTALSTAYGREIRVAVTVEHLPDPEPMSGPIRIVRPVDARGDTTPGQGSGPASGSALNAGTGSGSTGAAAAPVPPTSPGSSAVPVPAPAPAPPTSPGSSAAPGLRRRRSILIRYPRSTPNRRRGPSPGRVWCRPWHPPAVRSGSVRSLVPDRAGVRR